MRKRISYRDAAHGRVEGSPGEERGESRAVEAAEIRKGTDGPIGPRAVGSGGEQIPTVLGQSVAGPVATANPQKPFGAPAAPSVAGPIATADPHTPIPQNGSHTSKPGSKGGADTGHPLNKLHVDGAGTGTGPSSSGANGGESPHPQNEAKPGTAGAKPLPLGTDHRRHVAPPRGAAGSNRFTGGRREVGNYLAKIARGGAR